MCVRGVNVLTDLEALRLTFAEAYAARERGENPFGALIVLDGEVIAKASARELELGDPTAHAELLAVREACQTLRRLSLVGATLYSNVEPCIMCSGAIKWAGIRRVVFSVSQAMLQEFSGGRPKPSCVALLNTGRHAIEVVGPLLEAEGKAVLEGFHFRSKALRFAERG